MIITLACKAENPVEYLGCMGVYVISDRLDRATRGRWTDRGFVLETTMTEDQLISPILQSLQDFRRWDFTPSLFVDKAGSNITTEVRVPFGAFTARLNFWYQTAVASSQDPTDITMDSSPWKFFAGRQKIPATIQTFIGKISAGKFSSLSELISFQAAVDGRFGFDPTASRSALDVGYSPDKLGTPVLTSVAAELLTLVGVQYCFPSRCQNGARGWEKRTKEDGAGFAYSAWTEWLPFILGRHAACTDPGTRLFSPRLSRDKYKNLSFAKTEYLIL